MPFEINDDWNLISGTSNPVASRSDVPPGRGSQCGLGNINLSLFFSRKQASKGVSCGVEPVLSLPTAAVSRLGSKKWSTGPAGIALALNGPWTFSVQSEKSSNWETENWSVPINVGLVADIR